MHCEGDFAMCFSDLNLHIDGLNGAHEGFSVGREIWKE